MTEKKVPYKTDSPPKTLGEVLRALCEPFPEQECGWRILSKRGENNTWLWVRYPIGEFMKRRLAQCCTAGYTTDFFKEEVINSALIVDVALTIFDPERPIEHLMTVQGVGEAELEKVGEDYVIAADVRKAARTYAIKDAAELLGMGVGEGARAYTNSYTNPDGEQVDKYGIPISEYSNGHMTGQRAKKEQPNGNSALINDTAVKAWLEHRVEDIDTSLLGEDAYDKHLGALTATLKKMGFEEPPKVIAAAWGDEPNLAQLIALQNLAARTDGKETIQHLL